MREKPGYLLYDEVNDILPAEERTAEQIDDLFSTLERDGIDIYEDVATAKAVRAALKIAEPKEAGDQNEPARGEEAELDQSARLFGNSNDPVELYLREMRAVPLLPRESEVAIANRIERGIYWYSRQSLAPRSC